MPAIGLGLYRSPKGEETQQAIKWAFEAGYRHLDTAQIYGNEQDVGIALQQTEIPREEIFVTTKLWRDNHDNVRDSFETSLEKLQLDYVDLFLMHWPVKDSRLDAWDKMIELYDEGLAKSIGVSNFMTWHLEELLDYSDVVPAVNQIEYNPYLYKKDVLDICSEKGIILEAYSPLTKARKLDDPPLMQIAEKYGKTPAQILIRWVLEQDVIVIPKSTNKQRINENIDVYDFEISTDDMQQLNKLDENLVTGWNPQNQE